MNGIEGRAAMLTGDLTEQTQHMPASAGIMDRRAKQGPRLHLLTVEQAEHVNLIPAPDEPLDQPQETGNDPFRTAGICASGGHDGDLHSSCLMERPDRRAAMPGNVRRGRI